MLNMEEIEAEIKMLEAGKMNYSTLEKLSVLYSVRSQQDQKETDPMPRYSAAAEPKSEFERIARNADPEVLISVMDEHMETLKAIYPREYDSIIRKLQ